MSGVPSRVQPGTRWGRLTVVRMAPRLPDGNAAAECICDCGKPRTLRSANLTAPRGSAVECLDCTKETYRRKVSKHGMYKTPEFNTWQNMKDRCSRTTHASYADYGGRGIRVCERWQAFENFFADMGPRPSAAHSIDRIDNSGDYEPSNCRWTGSVEQQNNRRSTFLISAFGECLPRMEWSRRYGIPPITIWARIKRGWSTERAVREPLTNRADITAECNRLAAELAEVKAERDALRRELESRSGSGLGTGVQ